MKEKQFSLICANIFMAGSLTANDLLGTVICLFFAVTWLILATKAKE